MSSSSLWDLSLDWHVLQDVLAKRRPERCRELVAHVQAHAGVGQRRTCIALGFARSTIRYRSIRSDQAPLRIRILDLALTRVRYGSFRIYIPPRREGCRVNHKRINRLHREEGLIPYPSEPNLLRLAVPA